MKREWVDGHLARSSDRVLPGVAAIAGMAVTALVYLGVTHGQASLARG